MFHKTNLNQTYKLLSVNRISYFPYPLNEGSFQEVIIQLNHCLLDLINPFSSFRLCAG